MCAVHKRTLTVLPSEKAPARRERPWRAVFGFRLFLLPNLLLHAL